jgi:hypothetical protein
MATENNSICVDVEAMATQPQDQQSSSNSSAAVHGPLQLETADIGRSLILQQEQLGTLQKEIADKDRAIHHLELKLRSALCGTANGTRECICNDERSSILVSLNE